MSAPYSQVNAISSQTSFNFAVAKVLSILMVVSGHFFEGSFLWVPVTIGLFVFAFSSAYFTAKKYGGHFSYKSFWLNKLWRLAIPFWLAQGFLLFLFLAIGREGIWTSQTMVHWLGQSGWINWLGINNASPFGAGLWFMTLLLVFYLSYPLLYRWFDQSKLAFASLLLILVLSIFLSYRVNVGHALWLTAFAFIFGVYVARYPIKWSSRFWMYIVATTVAAMLLANFFGVKGANTIFLFVVSAGISLWIERAKISKRYFSWTVLLYPALLEIYLIHSYLFLRFNDVMPLRFVVSLVLILLVAVTLSRFGNILVQVIQQYFLGKSTQS